MKSNLRMILYVTAAMLCFILWNRWQDANRPAVSTPIQDVAQSTHMDGSVPNITSVSGAPVASVVGAADHTQLVRVKTDVYNLVISSKGATITYADLQQYPTSLKDKAPLPLVHEHNPNRMVIASGMVGANGASAPTHLTDWRSEKSEYTLADGQDVLTVPFTWTDGHGVTVTKTFTFQRGKYAFTIDQKIDNQSGKDWKGMAYQQIAFGEGVGPGGLGHVATFTGAVFSTTDNRYEKIDLSDIAKGKSPKELKDNEGWVAMIQHYFLGAIVPKAGVLHTLYTQFNGNNGDHIVGVKSDLVDVANGASHTFNSTAYVGPKITKNLETVAPYLDKTVDYGWLFMISIVMFKVMSFIHSILGNWGWAIVVMTLLIKLIFFTPSAWAYKSMAKMRALQPEMTKMRERFGDDRQGMSRAMMELYKKEKVNPMSGCLPMLLQIPFFIAFYYMLAESVELRQAPWIGWIHDLSIQDPYFVLPIINCALMFFQQKLNPPPADPMQQKVMMMLPLIFGFMFMWFPAGLVLYWTVSNAFGIIQQWVMVKRYGGHATEEAKK